MRRLAIPARANWRERAAESGFRFHTIDGEPYWDESAYYAFTLRQIEEDIEAPTQDLHALALDLVGDIVASESQLQRLAIPESCWDWIARSWQARDPHVYGRMDLAYDGSGPAKLYEFNYDTPTALFEAAFFQWQWLDDQQRGGRLPAMADQFNSIYESLVEAFATIARRLPRPVRFAALRDAVEDQGTSDYLRDCALQAGIDCAALALEDIGLSADGRYTDLDDNVIGTLFKLYPLEDLFREDFGRHLPTSGLLLVEPAWKAVLSNKGILPLLWEAHEGHPNLLPAYFDDGIGDLPRGWVRKPLHSREGANIAMHLPDGSRAVSDGPYGGPLIRQAFHPLPCFDGRHALVGSWVVGDRACGIGMREDASPITRDGARFVPHVILEQGSATLLA
ncbi:glutathionylspermidine synthase family protein [Dokdonella koreensis]|uniref:Glutathionylspermidine synthase n=1 Tax=Dokdonella koreensis DS-123 TaxID=1300342 RepID=A0A160DX49_9GAMM|nr:glutathionylspermidine synthase family protein [Dokdonella koreensis]ANB19074.1 Glutathionylspermidine synthase [Dokdonella koreensis DS-123]